MSEARKEGKNIARVTLGADCSNFQDLDSGCGTAANAFANYDTGSPNSVL